MTSLFRQPLRLASRHAPVDPPSLNIWICHSCRIHAAADKTPRTQEQHGLRRRKIPSQGSLRHLNSAATPILSTPEVSPNRPPSSQAAAEFLRKMFEVGLNNTSQDNSQMQHDVYGLVQALRDGDVERLTNALLHASEDHDYIVSIPKSSWTEIIRRLRPENILPPLHRIHRSFNDRKLQLIGLDPIVKRRAYMETIVGVIRTRRQYGIHLGIVDYRLLLQYAGRTGNESVAKQLWSDMRADGIQPDVLCYNAYMEAIVWDEHSRLRQRKRSKGLPWNWDVDEPKPTDIVLFKPGASVLVTEVFNEMVARRVDGNTATFCVLMTALARDGELRGAEGILSHAWGIDVATMGDGTALEQKPPAMRADSPTYPDQRLLSTIAQIFGGANQVHVALRLINYLSKHYDIRIAEHVWYQTLVWTWRQARIKESERRQPSELHMQLPMVTDFSNAMMLATNHTNPSMDHLELLFKSVDTKDNPGHKARLLSIFQLGVARYMGHWRRYREASYQFRKAQHRQPIWTVPRKPTDRLRHTAELAFTRKWLAYEMLQRWCRRLVRLEGTAWNYEAGAELRNDEENAWHLRGLPQFLFEHARFAPSVVKYRTATGRVQLLFRTQEEVDAHKRHGAALRERRNAPGYVIRRASGRWSSKAQLLPKSDEARGIDVGVGVHAASNALVE